MLTISPYIAGVGSATSKNFTLAVSSGGTHSEPGNGKRQTNFLTVFEENPPGNDDDACEELPYFFRFGKALTNAVAFMVLQNSIVWLSVVKAGSRSHADVWCRFFSLYYWFKQIYQLHHR